ncbi:MAG: integral rane protein MviN [Marmoricola sp.]|nr:integral rane protein MviN [Marmoricola sp.]
MPSCYALLPFFFQGGWYTVSDGSQCVVEPELRAGLGMALGTVFARLTGYLRSILLVATLGNALHADLFAIANTIPNMLVVLLGAGIFNAVLVPQVVKADRSGDGASYVNEVITLFGGFLLVATVLITVAAPGLTRLFLAPQLADQQFAGQYHSAIALAYLCLPQIFFYGMFALIGQILSARGAFGPMMWAPVLNNVVSIAVLAAYLSAYGSVADGCGGYAGGQERLLGVGMTAGVIVQCLALVPYLKRAGIHFRPTADLMSDRMRATIRLGAWTVAVVLVNQLAYGVIVRLASGGAASVSSCTGGAPDGGTGFTVYSSANLLIMAPHAIITVSLMTAHLPGLATLASTGRLGELGRRLSSSLRLVMVAMMPGIALIELLSVAISNLVWGYGAGASTYERFSPTVSCFGVALFFFTAHYVALRGLYALEATRVIFGIQTVIAVVNVGAAILLVHLTDRATTAPALASAFALAYAVGSFISWQVLRRMVGTIELRRILTTLASVGGCTALATVGCLALNYAVSGDLVARPTTKVGSMATVTATAVAFSALLFLSGRVIRVAEASDLRAVFAARGHHSARDEVEGK